MREFFALTLKSVKINSPHAGLIYEVSEESLFVKANKE